MARYWFPAKRRGWGWGPPDTWQGWLVMVGFAVLLAFGAVLFLPAKDTIGFLAYSVGLCGVLMIVCWIKGEPPRWR